MLGRHRRVSARSASALMPRHRTAATRECENWARGRIGRRFPPSTSAAARQSNRRRNSTAFIRSFGPILGPIDRPGPCQTQFHLAALEQARVTHAGRLRSDRVPPLADPAAPNATRANCRRAAACSALAATSRSASARIAKSVSSSSTSRPLTTAPTGLTRSWQTRLTRSAAKSRSFMRQCLWRET